MISEQELVPANLHCGPQCWSSKLLCQKINGLPESLNKNGLWLSQMTGLASRSKESLKQNTQHPSFGFRKSLVGFSGPCHPTLVSHKYLGQFHLRPLNHFLHRHQALCRWGMLPIFCNDNHIANTEFSKLNFKSRITASEETPSQRALIRDVLSNLPCISTTSQCCRWAAQELHGQ